MNPLETQLQEYVQQSRLADAADRLLALFRRLEITLDPQQLRLVGDRVYYQVGTLCFQVRRLDLKPDYQQVYLLDTCRVCGGKPLGLPHWLRVTSTYGLGVQVARRKVCLRCRCNRNPTVQAQIRGLPIPAGNSELPHG